MTPIEHFEVEIAENIRRMGKDVDVQALSRIWVREVTRYKYAYNFTWMGRPLIQFPQDMVALQEIFWRVKPDLIIETGIAHGGSLIYSASLMEMMSLDGGVLGIDIEIRPHNRREIETHAMYKRITMIEGSSTDDAVAAQVKEFAADRKRVIVLLDSNHTHDHVLRELHLYGPLVSKGSYVIVFDTVIEDMPEDLQSAQRPWGVGNSPKTAVWDYLNLLKTEELRATDGDRLDFAIDKIIENKLAITVAPDGYLKRV